MTVVRLARRQITSHLPRVVALVVATAVGAAFVAACLVYSTSVRAGVTTALSGGLDHVDAVVALGEPQQAATALATAAARPEVQAAYPADTASVTATVDGHPVPTGISTYVDRAGLRPALDSGRLPTSDDEVLVDALGAAAAHVTPGDRLPLTGVGTDGTDSGPARTVTVVGVSTATADSSAGYLQLAGPPALVSDLVGPVGTVWVFAEPGTSSEQLLATLRTAYPGADVRSGADVAAEQAAGMGRSVEQLFVALGAFAGVAVLVLLLVVRNTFAVLVAQRARQLALLRLVGASRRTVLGVTLVEALLLGLAGSVLGTALGIGVTSAVLPLVGTGADSLRPTDVVVPVSALVVPLLVGTVVTVVAAIGPARRAAGLRPVRALRPADLEPERPGAGRALYLVGGTLGLVVGGVLVVGGAMLDLRLAVLGGAVAALGALALVALAAPGVGHALGGVLVRVVPGGSRVAARLARTQLVRHPARTRATVAALVVGVGLITTLGVGAATIGAAAEDGVAARFPVDVSVSAVTGVEPDLLARLGEVDGLGALGRLTRADATVNGPSGTATDPVDVALLRADPAALAMLPAADRPQAGSLLLDPNGASALGVTDGASVEVSVGGRRTTLTVHTTALALGSLDRVSALVDPADLPGTTWSSAPALLWMDAADGGSAADLAAAVGAVVGLRSDIAVTGEAIGGAELGDVLDTLLLVSSALTGVAVLIALVGVGNTLAQSVHERRRELELLRALGTDRTAVRRTVALEAGLLAATGAVLGVGLGIVFGYAGAWAMGAGTSLDVGLVVPWGRVLLLAAGAVVAGLLAAAVPALAAARTSPTLALRAV